jgi:hypothetical protein
MRYPTVLAAVILLALAGCSARSVGEKIDDLLFWLAAGAIFLFLVHSWLKSGNKPPTGGRPADFKSSDSERIDARVKQLRRKAADEPFIHDKNYRENAARDLVQKKNYEAQKKEWDDEYWSVQDDEKLKKAFEERDPEVLRWLEARREIGFLAAKLAVEKRRKATTDEVRARMVGELRMRAFDQRELLRELGRQEQAIDDEGDIDPDDKKTLKQQLRRFVEDMTTNAPPTDSNRII